MLGVKPPRKRLHAFLYVPEGMGFHIVTELKNEPGALESLLNLLRKSVDLTNTISYNSDEGKAVSSVFAMSLDPSLTEEALKEAILESPLVEACQVVGSKGGLVVDTYHLGTELGPGEPLLAISAKGFSHMFQTLVKLFGTGGETILYEEGLALGRSNGEYVRGLFGKAFVKDRITDLAALYEALGWGISAVEVRSDSALTVRIEDCFECEGGKGVAKGCNFFKGHLVGIVSRFFDGDFRGEESKCRLRGDPHCEFELERVAGET